VDMVTEAEDEEEEKGESKAEKPIQVWKIRI